MTAPNSSNDPGRAGTLIEKIGYADILVGFAMFLLGDRIVPLGTLAGDLTAWQAVGLFGAVFGAGGVVLGRALAAKARRGGGGPVDRP